MKRIADDREIQTMDQARAAFQEIAQATLEIESLQADAERSIAAIKAQVEESTSDTRAMVAQRERALSAYILANKDHFQKPRKVKTAMGTFGLHTAAELKVEDLHAALAFVKEHAPECYRMEESLAKKEAAMRIESGLAIPGCRVISGDTAVYKVSRTWLEGQLKESANVRQG